MVDHSIACRQFKECTGECLLEGLLLPGEAIVRKSSRAVQATVEPPRVIVEPTDWTRSKIVEPRTDSGTHE